MSDRTNEFIFVGFWKRVLATLIDGAIGLALGYLIMPLTTWTIDHRTIMLEVIWSIIWTIFWLWLVVRFGGTPGKLVIGARIVDVSGKFLSWGRAVRRAVFPSLILTIISYLQTWKAISTYPDSAPHSNLLEIGKLINEYGQPFTMAATFFAFAIYFDVGVILFNRKKRAIHDFIAGSYVITKQSFLHHAEPGTDEVEPTSMP